MIDKLASFFSSFTKPKRASWTHRRLDVWPDVVYAVGDIHGRYDLLDRMEAEIAADGANLTGQKLIVMLGDYVDRGPRSSSVIDALSGLPPYGFERICLVGNHEAMMLEFVYRPSMQSAWLKVGGLETLQSYGIDVAEFVGRTQQFIKAKIAAQIPASHLDFLGSLAISLSLADTVFVHAGWREGIPAQSQTYHDLLWSRPIEFPEPISGLLVHGHTPAIEPQVKPHRICIDTGAFETGRLTAVRLSLEGPPTILTVSAA